MKITPGNKRNTFKINYYCDKINTDIIIIIEIIENRQIKLLTIY